MPSLRPTDQQNHIRWSFLSLLQQVPGEGVKTSEIIVITDGDCHFCKVTTLWVAKKLDILHWLHADSIDLDPQLI